MECEHSTPAAPYVCARCTAAGNAATFDRTEDGREEFAEHLRDAHRVDQVRPGRRYNR